MGSHRRVRRLRFRGRPPGPPRLARGLERRRPFWDALVVTKIDRGWRSVLAMLTDVERLDARGKSFQAATQPDLHTGGPMGRLVLSIMGAFAEFERELIRERTREGIARAMAEGKPVGKRGPDKKPRRRRRSSLAG